MFTSEGEDASSAQCIHDIVMVITIYLYEYSNRTTALKMLLVVEIFFRHVPNSIEPPDED